MKQWFKWFVHNSIVHPIMPFLPKKTAIKWHDRNGDWAFGCQHVWQTSDVFLHDECVKCRKITKGL